MSDIDLYQNGTDSYETLQLKRPDYVGAQNTFVDLATTYLKDIKELAIADLCSGTGNNTLLITQKLSIKNATLIDINKEFLEIAEKSDLKNKVGDLKTIVSDILTARLNSEYDAVISMFAYHHVPDEDKAKYIEIAKSALKLGGVLLLGEIYMPDKQTTLDYYEDLIHSIPENNRTSQLEQFLRQTASSDHFEYKVSKEFAHKQLAEAGFELLESLKVWPKDDRFSEDIGTYVEVWKLK